MKPIRTLLSGLFIIVGLIAALNLLRAQETATPVQGGTASEDVSSMSDFEIELQALEQTTPIPASQLPESGTFWSAQHAEDWPPLPIGFLNAPAWPLGDGVFVLDDLNVDYAALAQPKTTARSRMAGGMMAMDDDEGGDFTPALSFPTNGLWLQIKAVSNGLAYVNLNNATDKVYEIYSKTGLTLTNWTIEQELWPTNTNSMPFTISEQGRTNLFIWARDWTGITSNGNTTPEWWFYYWFGMVNLSDTNLDSLGNTLRYDYTNSLDPNVSTFSLQFTNTDLNTTIAYGSVTVSSGTPLYEAILVNDTNQADASWQPYSSTNIIVPLNSGNGLYNVQVGLRGLPSNARQSWVTAQLTLDNVAPTFTVVNPTNSTISVPMIQLQGYVSASLNKLTYDVSNAAGIFTNQQGYWQSSFYDTNLLAFTTNTFQCYDVALTNGLNQITLHATDVAGNTATTNVSYTLSYAGVTNAPALSIIWPTNGTSIAGSNVTVQAQMDDATATTAATVNSNTVVGLVERSGAVWFNNLPLNSSTNTVTITATNAAGNMSTTNLTIIQSAVSLTINPLSSGQMNQTNVTVSGTIGDSSQKVTVNGVSAMVSGTNWTAANVPVSSYGTASLSAQVTDSGNNPLAIQNVYQPQPAQVVLESYLSQTNYTYQTTAFVSPLDRYFYNIELDTVGIDWSYGAGGVLHYHETPYDTEANPYDIVTDLPSGENGFSSPWENVNTHTNFEGEGVAEGDYPEQISESSYNITQTHVMIQPSGQQAVGQSILFLVQAQVTNKDAGLQLAAGAVSFVNQLAGTFTADVTNEDGSIWSEGLVSAPAGAQSVEVTPKTAGQNPPQNISFTGMKTAKTKEDWQADVRTEINQDSDYTAMYAGYNASEGFDNYNRKNIQGVYAFYQQVYLEQPTEYYWCGLAKLAGAPVYAALSDAEHAAPLLYNFEDTLVQMNINILNDLAWQFEAYRKGGLNALEEINAVTHDTTVLDIAPWREIDQGIQQNNSSLILQGNRDLLQREQQIVLASGYSQLSSMDAGVIANYMSILAQCPVWDPNTSEPYAGRGFYAIVSGGNLTTYNDRWTWITTPTYGIWDSWLNLSSSDKTSQVSADLRTRAITYSLLPASSLY